MKILLRITFITLSVILLISVIAINITLYSFSYQEACFWILSRTGKLHKIEEFQLTLLTLNKFKLIRVAALTLLISVIGTWLLVVANRAYLKKKLEELVTSIKSSIDGLIHTFRRLSGSEKIALFAVLLSVSIIRIYYAMVIPITYDEAWTFLNFTRNGPLVSSTYYPAPNNHILHSLLTNLTFYLPFDATLNLQIPALLVSILTCSLFFIFSLNCTNYNCALISTSVFSSLFPSIYYGFLSRGYAIYVLAFVVGGYTSIRILTEGSCVKYWLFWILSSVMGFYAIPSYLYPFLSLTVIICCQSLWKSDYNRIRALLISGTLVSLFVVTLYLPTMVVSGISAIIDNKFVRPIGRKAVMESLIPHFKATFEYTFSSKYGWLVVLFLIFFSFWSKTHSLLAKSSIMIILFPFAFLILHGVIPFPRTWFYQIAVISLLFSICFEIVERPIMLFKPVGIIICVTIILSGFLIFSQRVKLIEELAFDTQKLFLAVKPDSIQSIYINDDLSDVILQYYFVTHNYPYNIYRAHITGELSQKEFEKYQLVILGKADCSARFISELNFQDITRSNLFCAYKRISP